MRNHNEEYSKESNDDDSYDQENNQNIVRSNNRSPNLFENQFRLSDKFESGDDYCKETLTNIEDQVKTSKLVLQLVTDSRFNMTQINGQRKLGGPPPGWKGPAPGPGCEVFVGKIPRTLYEHEIYPIFRRMGEVYEIRLMMDFSGTNRGYCFVMFGKPEFAQRAIKELDNYEIRPGHRIGVVASINNCRLYVGQLPPDVTSETVIRKIYDITDDVSQVSVYRNANDQARYALISYKTHRGAAMARRRLVPDRASLFGDTEVSIDWAHPSMFPSNVVEDSGNCDDHGNIEISRMIIGSDNKRCQNRRRVRDDFLDHSIRAYLQTDRMASGDGNNNNNNKQNSQRNQNLSNNNNNNNNKNCPLSNITRGINSFQIFDQNSTNSQLGLSQNYHQRHNNTKVDKNASKIDIPIKLMRDSNSSFDMKIGSASSSESSGYSSQSSASNRHDNSPKEFSDCLSSNNFYHSQIFSPVNNEGEIFLQREKIGGIIFRNRSDENSSDNKFGNNDLPSPPRAAAESLNLFDNYSFSGNSKENAENIQHNFNDIENNGEDFSSVSFDDNYTELYCGGGKILNEQFFCEPTGEKYSHKIIGKDLEMKRDCERKSREHRVQKSIRHLQKSQNFENLDILKSKHSRGQNAANYSQFSRTQNHNGIANSSIWNKNGRNSTAALRLVGENNLMQQHLCENELSKIGNSPNPRYFVNNVNLNGNKKSSWISAHVAAINCYDLSSNNFANNSANNLPIYADSEYSGNLMQQGDNSQTMHFYNGQNVQNSFTQQNAVVCCQNRKICNAKNQQKYGRPILSRSYLSIQ